MSQASTNWNVGSYPNGEAGNPQTVAHSMHAPQTNQPDTTMLSVVPGSFPITPDAPQQGGRTTIRDFVPELPGYQGLTQGQWDIQPDSGNTWENPPRITEAPRFSPTNPFVQGAESQHSRRSNEASGQEPMPNPFNVLPSTTTRTPTSVSASGQIEDRTMRMHDHIPIPPPAPRIHRYDRASPYPIIFNLPEAGNVAAAAQRSHPGRAEPWAQLETWIYTAMRELGQYLEVNFHETFPRIGSVRRDMDQLQGVVTGISEEQNNF